MFERLGTPIPPEARVGDLRIGDQQMVEIAKALAFDAAILIMDEPTSALSDAEVARLFRVIERPADGGDDGPLHLAQDERGLHAGRPRDRPPRRPVRGTRPRAPRPRPGQVVRWMVGREIAELQLRHDRSRGGRPAEVEGLALPSPPGSGRPSLRKPSRSQLRRGEVLGVAGLLGAGRTELLEALFGAAGPRRPATIRAGRQAGRGSGPGRGDRRGAWPW